MRKNAEWSTPLEKKAKEDAARKLKFARILHEDGNVERARESYGKIIRLYTQTEAADKARQLLAKLRR